MLGSKYLLDFRGLDLMPAARDTFFSVLEANPRMVPYFCFSFPRADGSWTLWLPRKAKKWKMFSG
jgi:hypothetical protein